ncbi:hypothetical protein ACWPKO_23560 (plasmid) [Coraliomargarita sp. W4R53]
MSRHLIESVRDLRATLQDLDNDVRLDDIQAAERREDIQSRLAALISQRSGYELRRKSGSQSIGVLAIRIGPFTVSTCTNYENPATRLARLPIADPARVRTAETVTLR